MQKNERIFIVEQCGKLESAIADLTQLVTGISDNQSFIKIAIREQITALEGVRIALMKGGGVGL